MVREFKEGLFRLTLGAILFLLLLGFYMRAINIGAFYNSVDDYLIVLPIVRLAFIVIAVAVLIGLARPLSEVCIDAIAIIDKNLGWGKNDEGPKIYKDFLYYPLFIAFLVIGYFLIAPRLREAITPIEGYNWVLLVFTLIWSALVIAALVYCCLRAREEYTIWRSWVSERRATCRKVGVAQQAVAGAASARLPRPETAIGTQAASRTAARGTDQGKRQCSNCGNALKTGASFCGECGEKVS